MRIELQQVERTVNLMIGKPLAWAVYGCGVALAFVTVGIFHGGKWLLDRRKEVTWAR
jgi:hypothetical protein